MNAPADRCTRCVPRTLERKRPRERDPRHADGSPPGGAVRARGVRRQPEPGHVSAGVASAVDRPLVAARRGRTAPPLERSAAGRRLAGAAARGGVARPRLLGPAAVGRTALRRGLRRALLVGNRPTRPVPAGDAGAASPELLVWCCTCSTPRTRAPVADAGGVADRRGREEHSRRDHRARHAGRAAAGGRLSLVVAARRVSAVRRSGSSSTTSGSSSA